MPTPAFADEYYTSSEFSFFGRQRDFPWICLALLFAFRHFVGNFVGKLAESDRLFSNINWVDEVTDEVRDEGTKG